MHTTLGVSLSKTYLALYTNAYKQVPLYASLSNNTCVSNRKRAQSPRQSVLERQEHAVLPVVLRQAMDQAANVTAAVSRKGSLLFINGCMAFYCVLDSVLSTGSSSLVCPMCLSSSTPLFLPHGTVSFSCQESQSPTF